MRIHTLMTRKGETATTRRGRKREAASLSYDGVIHYYYCCLLLSVLLLYVRTVCTYSSSIIVVSYDRSINRVYHGICTRVRQQLHQALGRNQRRQKVVLLPNRLRTGKLWRLVRPCPCYYRLKAVYHTDENYHTSGKLLLCYFTLP